MTIDQSFEGMRKFSTKNWKLAIATSFIQVEDGIDDLMACWEGFLHVSEEYNEVFEDETEMYQKFTDALNEYIEYLEPTSNQVGSSFY